MPATPTFRTRRTTGGSHLRAAVPHHLRAGRPATIRTEAWIIGKPTKKWTFELVSGAFRRDEPQP